MQVSNHHHAAPEPEVEAEGEQDLDETRPVGGAIPREIRDEIMTEVRRSPRMREVLKEIDEHGGSGFDLTWSARGGTHRAGAIALDRRYGLGTWIASMMHELNHLNDYHQGRQPNTATDSRADFVNGKMQNEIRAHAIAYVGLIEREGRDPETPASAPAGFTDFREHLADREEATESCLTSPAIQKLAEDWLEDQYRNHWQTSNTGENYYDYWGHAWDEMNDQDP